MRKRSRKIVEQEDTHRWVISYADFITLLFAFFVVMYAISSVNVSKYRAFSDGVTSAFSAHGQQKKANDVKEEEQGHSAAKVEGASDQNFHTLNDSLAVLQDDNYHLRKGHGWIELDIKAGALYDSGSADLKPHALVKIMKIAQIIKKQPYPVFIEGYTDSLPIHTAQFPSNWELSSARAAALARSLASYGVNPDRITITGYGAQYPVADNQTKEGRAKNRRVNLIIAKDRFVPRLMNPAYNKEKQPAKQNIKEPHGTKSHIVPLFKESR